MSRALVVVVVAVIACPASASPPGQPVDCGDWEPLQPGFQCVMVAPSPCDSMLCRPWRPDNLPEDEAAPTRAIDNEGHVLAVRRVWNGGVAWCQTSDRPMHYLELVEYRGAEEVVIGRFVEKCKIVNTALNNSIDLIFPSRRDWTLGWDYREPGPGLVAFDAMNGRALIPLRSICTGHSSVCNPDYPGGYWLAAITGFATTFEILQTYDPRAGSFGFRTPYMPEGLQRADYFDSYWGEVTRPLDLAQAQPLQCQYPTAPPRVGDYFALPDLPQPAVGRANYLLTAVTFGGQTRAGRKAEGGRLSGRDASVLPECSVP